MKKSNVVQLDEDKALKRVREYEAEIDETLKSLAHLEGHEPDAIQTDGAYASICEAAILVKAREKVMAEEHKGFREDVQKLLDRVDGWFKPAREKHARAERVYKEAIRGYVLRLESKARGLRMAAAKLGARDNDRREQLYIQADALGAPPTPGISFSPKVEITVTDFQRLPNEYKMLVPDEKKIVCAIEKGEEIPGVRWKDARIVRITPKHAGKEIEQ